MRNRFSYLRSYKPHILLISVCIFGSALLWAGRALYQEWRAGYVVLYQPTSLVNLLKFHVVGLYEHTIGPYLSTDEEGLPIRRIYLSENARLRREDDLPENTKIWQPGYGLYPDGQMRKIKARFIGDNPFNWAYSKKSWRIKTRKRSPIGGWRTLNYVRPRATPFLSRYLGQVLALKVGVFAVPAEMVELHINDKIHGVAIQMPDLDEVFLRRRQIMPVNLYKGEQENMGRRYGVETNLFNNADLWEKKAVFNQLPESDRTDLERLFAAAEQAQVSWAGIENLQRMARVSEWAKFSAFETLAQSWHATFYHNQRLISDPWRGTVTPVSHDTGLGYAADSPKFWMDRSTHIVSRSLHGSSKFILAKYRYLYEFLNQGGLDELDDVIDEIVPRLRASFDRDPSRFRTAILNAGSHADGTLVAFDQGVAEIKNRITRLDNWLRNALKGAPGATYSMSDGVLALTVDGYRPVAKISFVESGAFGAPKRAFWDRDGNGRISAGDVELPVHEVRGKWVIDAVFLSNRPAGFLPPNVGAAPSDHSPQATTFRILFAHPVIPSSFSAENPLDGTHAAVTERLNVSGATPTLGNIPVIAPAAQEPLVFSGVSRISEDQFFDVPVQIQPGSRFMLKAGVSMIFRAGVDMRGTPNDPIVFEAHDPQRPWGGVAVFGAKSDGSRMSHVMMSGGSGDVDYTARFIAMLSLQNVKDVVLRNVIMENNHTFDDMLHVVYGKEVIIRDSKFLNARSDAVDVDISDVLFSNVEIVGPGNDGIDLMDSVALIERVHIRDAGDKGVSVGEASVALIRDSDIKNNKIGIEAKDKSIAALYRSRLLGNAQPLNAYKKNWRYFGGARVVADSVVFENGSKPIRADKHSQITIANTYAPSVLVSEGNVDIANVHHDDALSQEKTNPHQIITEIEEAWRKRDPGRLRQ